VEGLILGATFYCGLKAVFLGLFQLLPNFVNTQKLPDWRQDANERCIGIIFDDSYLLVDIVKYLILWISKVPVCTMTSNRLGPCAPCTQNLLDIGDAAGAAKRCG
jgi:hypothetical protein